MKKIDHLIVGEMAGPWLFGVGMFTTLIVASTYLLKTTDYVVQGVSIGVVLELMGLLLPGVIVKTFAMAVLLAALLGFGRLSSDSEITALRAAGVSILRMMVPVAGFSLAIAAVAFLINETVVPAATLESLAIQNEIARTLNVKLLQPASQPIMLKGKMVGQVMAADFDLRNQTLRDAIVVAYNDQMAPTSILYARELRFNKDRFAEGAGWEILGGAKIISFENPFALTIRDRAWPSEVPRLNARPEDLITNQVGELDSFNTEQMREHIETERLNKNVTPVELRNLEFGYWNKFALPLAAIIYGLLGAPLGIRNARTGAASGFALSIGIIFVYVTLGNFMNVYAQGGVIPPYVASFTPLLIGLLASGVIMWRRNK